MTEASQEKMPEKSRSFRRILSLVLLLLLVVAAFVYVPMWMDSYRRGQLQRLSLPELEQLTKNQPGNTEALYRLGVVYGREGRYPDAVRTFLAVLEKEPTRADVLNDLGVTYMLMERYYEALVAYQGALQIKPDYATAHANLGRLYLATKMPFSANRSLQRAIELDPRNLDTLCDLGEAGQQTLNLQQAEDAYKRALAINDQHAPAYIGLGRTYYSRGRLADAEEMIRKALTIEPESSVALMTLARIRLDKPGASDADLREAQEYLQRARKTDDRNPDIWYDMGRISLRQNQPAEAIEHLKQALILSPQHMGAMQQIERALRLAGRKAEADRVSRVMRERALREREEMRLEETVGRTPNDWDSQAKLAQLYTLSGKRGLAMLIVRRMQQEAPQHPALPQLQRALDAMQAQPNTPDSRP